MTSGTHSNVDLSQMFDVLVIGGGNAALCAAMTAKEAGAAVLLLECSPRHFRGGNSRHTRNLRYMHESANDHLTGPYPEEEFMDDLMRVTDGRTNKMLARFMIRQSKNVGEWMSRHGCMFQPSMRGTLHLSRTNAFFLGGGTGEWLTQKASFGSCFILLSTSHPFISGSIISSKIRSGFCFIAILKPVAPSDAVSTS